MKKRMVSLFLVLCMGLGLCACGDSPAGGSEAVGGTENGADVTDDMDYSEMSAMVYDAALGEFYDTYEGAKNADSVAERYAQMAVAEAKLLESGVLMPTYS